jgi:hypothetical protein
MTRIGAPTMKGEVIQGKTLVSFVRILPEVIALRIGFISTLCFYEESGADIIYSHEARFMVVT